MIADKAYFISDAHLGMPLGLYDSRETVVPQFIKSLRNQARYLYIVGDLFDFWIEYRHAIRPIYFPVLGALRELVESGVEVHYCAGNHDFALGPFLSDTIGLIIHSDPVTLPMFGKQVHLFHGDGTLKKDVGYRILKKILRNPVNQRLFRLLHPDLGVALASFFSGSSRKFLGFLINEARLSEYRVAARKILDNGADVVVFGHTHHPELTRFDDGKIYCNTGEWIRRYTYACMTPRSFDLWEHCPGKEDVKILR